MSHGGSLRFRKSPWLDVWYHPSLAKLARDLVEIRTPTSNTARSRWSWERGDSSRGLQCRVRLQGHSRGDRSFLDLVLFQNAAVEPSRPAAVEPATRAFASSPRVAIQCHCGLAPQPLPSLGTLPAACTLAHSASHTERILVQEAVTLHTPAHTYAQLHAATRTCTRLHIILQV